jgi:hypothetical protein
LAGLVPDLVMQINHLHIIVGPDIAIHIREDQTIEVAQAVEVEAGRRDAQRSTIPVLGRRGGGAGGRECPDLGA